MNKAASIAALAAVSVMTLAGCAQGPAGEAAARPSAAAKPMMVTPAQEASLRTELRAVDKSLDTPQVLPDLVMMCKMIQRGMPDRVQRDQVERIFFRSADPAAAVPDGAADRILKVINSNGFCQA